MKKRIYIGVDHAGFKLKEELKIYLSKNYFVIDLGNKKLDINDDYPIYAAKVGKAVVKNKNSFGILICGSGQGVSIAANKIKGVRAALCETKRDARLARSDDDANILCLQGRYVKSANAKRIAKIFFGTKFKNNIRYKRRINEINKIEK
ncbi:RpiB/LacA/LacB family sugar-phosphate isomerase [Candidatus Woesearchaeota archaeon]|nr:RpiB/LacA/LacB family sugar-phosphate isomerase [Candidatus Woesearchaeota archaeon]